MAEVWKAKVEGAAGFEKIIAIKRILPHLIDSQEFVGLFIEEAKLVAGLVHPNIVQVFDFGELEGGAYYLAMEYVPGTNLARLLDRLKKSGARLPLEIGLYVGIETCKALGYAHSRAKPVTHRDISPHNMLLSYEGEVKVADFGIAKVEGSSNMTDAGVVRGKAAFMSPEQANAREIDHRSDLFSLGVVLFEIMTGERLYEGKGNAELFSSAATFQEAPADKLEPLPYSVREVIRTALQADPEERYQTAAEMESDLTNALGSSTVAARQAFSSLIKNQFDEELQIEDRYENRPTMVARTATFSAGATGMKPIPQAPTTLEPPSRSFRARALFLAVIPVLLVAGGYFSRGLWWPEADAAVSPTQVAMVSPTPGVWPGTSTTETPKPTPTPRPTPVSTRRTPVPTRRVVRATPRPTRERIATPNPTPVAVAYGTLSVQARPWAEVWVDGQRISRETPVHRKLSAGVHEVTVVHPSGFKATQQVRVPADGRVRLMADVNKKSFVVQR